MPKAHTSLKNAYDSPVLRLNSEQIEVSEWIKDNTNEIQNVSIMGPPSQIMQKVWWMSSFSHRTSFLYEGFLNWKTYAENREQTIQNHLENDLIVVDYSDVILFGSQELVDQIIKFEEEKLVNHTIIYQTNSIRVYKYENT